MDTKVLEHLDTLIQRYPQLSVCREEIWNAYLVLKETYERDGKLLVAGNGGSAADAEHIVGELMKGFKMPRKPETDFAEKLAEHPEIQTVFLATDYEVNYQSMVKNLNVENAYQLYRDYLDHFRVNRGRN